MRDSKDDDLVCSVDFFFFFKLLRNVNLYISEPHLQGWASLYSAHYLKKNKVVTALIIKTWLFEKSVELSCTGLFEIFPKATILCSGKIVVLKRIFR